MTKWTDETKKALLEAVEWATRERFRAKGERWGAVSAMVYQKTGVHYLARTCRARHEMIMQERHNAERDRAQKRLKLPDGADHIATLSRELGLLFGELVAMREEMRAMRRVLSTEVERELFDDQASFSERQEP